MKRVTNIARARGVVGSPTLFVEGEMFGGHDRTDYVARAAAGPR